MTLAHRALRLLTFGIGGAGLLLLQHNYLATGSTAVVFALVVLL